MISIQTAVQVILYLIVGGVIFWLLNWALEACGVPEPFHKVAKVILVVLAVFVVIGILLSLVGGVPLFRP